MNSYLEILLTYRLIRLLSTEWKDLQEFEQGIIDERGKILIKGKLSKYRLLLFRIKKMLERVPGIVSKVGTYSIALGLLKEHNCAMFEQYAQMTQEEIENSASNLPTVERPLGKVKQKDKFAGCPIYDVDGKTFMKCKFGKNRFHKWSKYVEESGLAEEIKSEIKKTPVVIRHGGSMMYLKRI